MLYIKKESVPKVLTEKIIAITKSDEWKNADENNTKMLRSFFDSLDKQLIRDSLFHEQHGLCAYCMKRIYANNQMNIEHFLSINGHKDRALDYGNMLGCCKGGSDTNEINKVICCDAAKKEKKITINPQNKDMMAKIRYNKEGRIYVYPEDAKLQHDIDQVLMLNGKLDDEGRLKYDTSTKVVEGRRLQYKKFEMRMRMLKNKYINNEDKIKTALKKRIDEIESMEQYPEYAGVELFFLRRRIR